ncbi:MAG: tetratricopeptide repeat protein [Elusimicrobia bacterium]|nr:tetratricopeptide repeat protein [Elusimicrobiota bacterium]
MSLTNAACGSSKIKFFRKICVFAEKIPLPALLCLLVLAALFPVLNNGFVDYDDVQYVLSNTALRGSWLDALAFSPGYYHPVVTLIYKAEFFLFGLNPLPYHITSLALHLANCASVFYLFLLLGWRREAAFLGALLFGVHPVQVEPVAWISGRKELLWGFFAFWTLSCYLKYIDTGKNRFFILSLFCFILAVLSKPFALMLAFALPLADYYRKRVFSAVLLFEKVPYFLAAFSLFLLSWAPSGFLLGSGSGVFNLSSYAAGGGESLLFYLGKFVAPVNLSAMYPPPALPAAPAGWFFLLFAAVSALYCAWRILRGPERGGAAKAAVFCLGFFLITIFPALLIFPPADRYGYVPAAGLFFIYSFLALRLYEIFSQSRGAAYSGGFEKNRLKRLFSPGRVLAVIVAAHCAILGVASFERAAVWRNTFSLCNDVLKKYPREAAAYRALSDAHRAAGRYQDALADLNRCIELRPDDWKALSNRAGIFVHMREFDKAISDCGAAIRNNPGSALMFFNRGNAYFLKGEYAAAIRDYDRALAISPAFSAAAESKRNALGKLK